MQTTSLVFWLIVVVAICALVGAGLYLRRSHRERLLAIQPYNYLLLALILGVRGITMKPNIPMTMVVLSLAGSSFFRRNRCVSRSREVPFGTKNLFHRDGVCVRDDFLRRARPATMDQRRRTSNRRLPSPAVRR